MENMLQSRFSSKNPILVLVNPVSGKGEGRRSVEPLTHLFRDYGLNPTIILTTGPGQCMDIVKDKGEKFEAIIAVGGDGTINEVAGVIYHLNLAIPMGIIPLGHANCLARHLSLPQKLEEAVRVIVAGKQKPVGVAEVEGRIAIAFIGIGFDAAVVNRVAKSRKSAISDMAYIKAAMLSILDGYWGKYQVAIDGQAIEGRWHQIILSAISNYAHYFSLTSSIGFEAYLYRGSGVPALARTFFRAGPDLDLGLAADLILPVKTSMEVTSEKKGGYYQIDGESGGTLPIRCEVKSPGLYFIVP